MRRACDSVSKAFFSVKSRLFLHQIKQRKTKLSTSVFYSLFSDLKFAVVIMNAARTE